jgi:hypothetical protein
MTRSTKKLLLGLLTGTAISAALLILMALWPLSQGPNAPLPALSPVPATGPDLPNASTPMFPESAPSEMNPADSGRLAPSSDNPLPPGKETPSVLNKPSVPANRASRPNKEMKEAEKPPEKIPEVPRSGATEEAKSLPPVPDQKRTEVASITPSDMDRVHSLLHRVKSDFERKDLAALKKNMKLSIDQESSLNIIFNAYNNIRTEMESTQPIANGVSSALIIISMENDRGNLVFPGPRWSKQPLTIPSDSHRWSQVLLVGTTFTHPPAVADLIAPTIFHTLPAYTASPGNPTQISAKIIDNSKILEATLHFRAQGDREYETAPMSEGEDHAFTGRIPGSMIKGSSTSMEYYIKAKDAEGNVSMEGRPNSPLIIAVVPPSAG